jgi:hypothetical protein
LGGGQVGDRTAAAPGLVVEVELFGRLGPETGRSNPQLGL